MAKVTYLHHSGFAVELDQYVLVFDDCLPDIYTPPLEKRLVVFVSHKHQDHFQLKTLQWAERISKNTRYFVGNDIKLNEKYLAKKGIDSDILQRMVRMKGNMVYEHAEENFKVETLRSTDQGVAFLVSIEGFSIYHAGDLNHWYWEEEPEDWNKQMERAYRKEIDGIAGKEFDIAFVVLDPRLGAGSFLGMDYFLQKVSAKNVFPMHMWDDYEVIGRYRKTCIGQKYSDKIREVSEINREFLLLT
ncbi:MAG: MBL fold metallo-hydrolase [Lachnospiraceae bacterium]|nr:MBL fold metallo-hydrolase [Lachnospiraceae bacterium]MDE6183930.1 MBL fold metallo-hydrolase [Lachnospiraceae bacterium]MDE7286988.1 MBL fold metallo-hydrolase [Lachnospiraceae bacterium]